MKRPQGDGTETWHGSAGGYTNHKCGCDKCRAAWSAYTLDVRARRAVRLADDPTLATHGTKSTYFNWKCRCIACRAAHNEYERGRIARRKETAA